MNYDKTTAHRKARQLIAVSSEPIAPQQIDNAISDLQSYLGGRQINSNQQAALISLIAHIGGDNFRLSVLAMLIDTSLITGSWQLHRIKTEWHRWHTNEPEYWQREAEFDLFICERG